MNTLAGTPVVCTKNSIVGKLEKDYEKYGSIQNRAKYGFKQYVNLRKTQAKDAFVTSAGLAASVGAAAVVAKSKTAQQFIQKGLDYVKNSDVTKQVVEFSKELGKKATPYLEKAADWVGNLPTPAKAALIGGALITGIASRYVRAKGVQNSGALIKEQEISAKLEKQQQKQNKDLLG